MKQVPYKAIADDTGLVKTQEVTQIWYEIKSWLNEKNKPITKNT